MLYNQNLILNQKTILILWNFTITFFFFFGHTPQLAILVPRPGIEPGPLVVKAQSPNHWTAREFPTITFLHLLLSQLNRALLQIDFSNTIQRSE